MEERYKDMSEGRLAPEETPQGKDEQGEGVYTPSGVGGRRTHRS